MAWVWSLAVFTVVSFLVQGYLSYRDRKWLGAIFPAAFFLAASIFLALNLLHAFPQMEAYGSFLTVHGSAGFFAVILKIGFLYMPAAVHAAIYFVAGHLYQKAHHPASHNKEYKKMLAKDL